MTAGSVLSTTERVSLSPKKLNHIESTPGGYYQGLNEKLYAALPPARRVLELGCAGGKLGELYKQAHPDAYWVGVDISAKAVEIASTKLDQAFCLNLDEEDLDRVGSGFDCIVFGDLLEHLKRPEQLLQQLKHVAEADTTLVCCVPNMNHISIFERMLNGDLSYDDEGLLDRTHLRFYSRPSLFKMLLDCGWIPDFVDIYAVGTNNPAFAANLITSAAALEIPASIATDYLTTYQMIVRSKRRSDCVTMPLQPFSVVVAVTNEAQVGMNILRSPGLSEMQAEVLLVRNATSAADAFYRGAQVAANPWLLFCHQDVYLPSGTGEAIASVVSNISKSCSNKIVLGFAGIALDGINLRKAGLVIDRAHLFDFPASSTATSIDEFCVGMHKECIYKIDAELGWHLWATDLCLQAYTM